MTRKIVRFECGAKLPREGWIKGEAADYPIGHRFKLAVNGIYQTMTKPLMPDGKTAPCLWDCPKKRASGRRQQRVWRDDEHGESHPDGQVVTCHGRIEAAEP